MAERWVKATYVDEERLGPISGTTTWVNMGVALRIRVDAVSTFIECSRVTFGPFAEPPEHFMPIPLARYGE